ncbi:MAG: TlpA family protein disulfide reductase [Candidatus Nanohaloarchaea archaeon]
MDRRAAALAAGIGILLLAGIAALAGSGDTARNNPSSSEDSGAGNWTTIELTDVRSGETFTVAEFDQPVLVETFAVWCPTCTRQQEEVKKLHEQVGDDIVSVSLNTDPNEDAQKVRRHIQQNGFDWRYAVAPPELTQALVDQFGPSILNAPLAPMIVVCPNGTTERLPNGVKPASELQSAVDQRC